jgi:hypothetical protein
VRMFTLLHLWFCLEKTMREKAKLVVRKTDNALRALDELNSRLFKLFGKPVKCRWTFPDGTQDELPTWSKRVKTGISRSV